jgi:hypothetical protein
MSVVLGDVMTFNLIRNSPKFWRKQLRRLLEQRNNRRARSFVIRETAATGGEE